MIRFRAAKPAIVIAANQWARTMMRRTTALLALLLAASACASSTFVVSEVTHETSSRNGTSVATGSAISQSDGTLEEAIPTPDPLATVSPLPTVTPTPTPPKWVVVTTSTPEPSDDDAASSSASSDPDPEQGVPAFADRYVVGACYTSSGIESGKTTPCTESHIAEALVVGKLWHSPGADFPSKDSFLAAIDETCIPRENSFGLTDVSGMKRSSIWPNPANWKAGDRSFVCFLKFAQPVRQSLASIAADQAIQQAAQQEAYEQERQARKLKFGDCVAPDHETKVSCSGPHAHVVYGRGGLASAGGVYPGVSLIEEQAFEFCNRERENMGLSGNMWALWPNQYDWEENGDHTFVCMIALSKSQFDAQVAGG